MKKLFTLLLLFALAKVGFSQTLTDTIAFQGVLVPKYMASGGSTRLPVVFRAKVSFLSPNTTYRYYNNGATYADFGGTGAGAGTCLYVSDTSWGFSSTGSLTTAGSHETFTTDNNGEFEGWFAFSNTGNARFTKGNYIHPTIVIGDNSGTLMKRWAMKDSILVLGFSKSHGANDATGIYGYSSAPEKEMVALYEQTTDTRPASMAFVESPTITAASGTYTSNMAKFYTDSVRPFPGAWGTVIRNNVLGGIRKIERLSFATGAVEVTHTDADGNWPTSADTRYPGDSTDALFLNDTDVPLKYNPVLVVNQVGFTNDFGISNPGTASSGSNVTISGSGLKDTVFIQINAPFEARVGINAYSSNTIKLLPSNGNINLTVLDVRFNPSTTGAFTDTIYISSAGATTHKIAVKGTSLVNPEISFKTATLSAREGDGSVSVQVNIVNANSNFTRVDIGILSPSTATEGVDFTLAQPYSITFPANSSDSIVFTIPIADDTLPDGREIIMLGFTTTTNGAIGGVNDTLIITLFDNDYRKVDIKPIRGVNGQGIQDSLGGLYEVTGIVHGYNVRNPSQGGFQFTVTDVTGGIAVFSNSNTFGYSVAQGDSVTVRGELSSFNGLAQLSFLDTVIFWQSNRPLHTPKVVTKLDETTESELVRLNNLTISAGNWINGNHYAYLPGGDSIQIRVANNTNNMIGALKPNKKFSIIGIGGQFDNTSPFTSGYQLFPRDSNDLIVIPDSLSPFSLVAPADNHTDTVQGAFTQTLNFTWDPALPAQGLQIPTYVVLADVPTGDFSNPVISLPSTVGGTGTALPLAYLQLIDILVAQNIQVGQSLSLKWTVEATTSNNHKRRASQERAITIVRGVMNGVDDVANNIMTLYPNPATGTVYVEMPEVISNASILTIDGKVLVSYNAINNTKVQLALDDIANGLYIIQVETESGTYTQRLSVSR